MTLSNRIKKQFVKDHNLPINVVNDEVFTYCIETIDPHFKIKNKYDFLKNNISTFGEEIFFTQRRKAIDTLVAEIKKTDAFATLMNDKLEKYNFIAPSSNKTNLFTMENVNHTFVSIDLKHANFNVLKMYDPELVLNHSSYNELMGSVTDKEYIKESKYIRQVIFGNLLPKKQQTLQKWVMNECRRVLYTDVGIDINDIISVSADEVVISVSPTNVVGFVKMIEQRLSNNPSLSSMYKWIKVDPFTLKSIGGKKFFVKENHITDEVEFKCIPAPIFMQVYKHYTGDVINQNDLLFYFDGYLSEFKDRVFSEDV